MPAPVGPYTPAVRAGNLVFTSGQIGLSEGALVEGVEAQTSQAIANLKEVLAANGSSLSHVAKTTVFLTDMANYAVFNDVYAQGFEGHRPARSTVAVRALPLGALVEIEAVATLS